jgi:site-specific recombinase
MAKGTVKNLNKSHGFFARWRFAFRNRVSLDALFLNAPEPGAHLTLRTQWFLDLLQWIRSEGTLKHEFDFESGTPQAARLRYLLQVLERQLEWKLKLARILRSIVHDTHALDLFLSAGLSHKDSFWGELSDRLSYHLLPQTPNDEDLAVFFSQNFGHRRDVQWFRQIDPKTFAKVLELFSYEEHEDEKNWNSLLTDAKDAILLLAIQIRGIAMGSEIRHRISQKHFTELPFYRLANVAEKLVSEKDSEHQLALSFQMEQVVENCFLALREVYQHLDEYGLSIHLVYLLDRTEAQLHRVRDLVALVIRHSGDPQQIASFIANLVEDNHRRRSIRALLGDSLSLLSRKIAERTAETGEHYITRTRREFYLLFKSSLGGGYVTTFTTLVKFTFYDLGLSGFFFGLAASLNYAASFLLMFRWHFTLGTKQPAMTAPALAAKMHKIHDPAELEKLVDEIIHLVRSQVVSVLGNVIGVVPLTIVMCWLWNWIFHKSFITQDQAEHVLHEFSVLGPTPLYAAFTGVLLFTASLISGWADNWFAFRRMTTALSHNRRLRLVLGEKGARRLAYYFKGNISGIVINIALGFLLGLTPSILHFFGIPLDIRHVTLSSGSIGAAMATLPAPELLHWPFWLAVLGVASMGVFNISVSFGLALWVAIRARRVQGPQRDTVLRAVWRRILSRPGTLFLPDAAKDKSEAATK